MLGKMTKELQSELRPIIDEILTDFGHDYTIIRPGNIQTTVRGLVYQLEDRSTISKIVEELDVKVNSYQGIFKYDAVLDIPYWIMDESGEVFVPDGITEDPGGQDVARFCHLASVVDRTRVETLIFPTGKLVRDPRTDNWIPGSQTSLTVEARLHPTMNPEIRETVGADALTLVLVGRWGSVLNPQTQPKDIVWGETCPLNINGQKGTLKILQTYPDQDLFVEKQFGERFIASWSTDVVSRSRP